MGIDMSDKLKDAGLTYKTSVQNDDKPSIITIAKPDVNVAKQTHYASFSIEPIDYMKAIMSHEEFEGYLKGNVIKYISRYKLKDGIKDLQKARVYLDWLEGHVKEACCEI